MTQLEELQRAIKEQIESSSKLKNEKFLSSQSELIRAEEKMKFEREILEIKEECDRKIRKIREDVFEREKRIAQEAHSRHEEMDRTSYNQRQSENLTLKIYQP